MYDNFDMNRCVIVDESYDPLDDDKAEVQFIAELVLRETGEVTAFMETSQFERAKTHGGWLYLNGTIEAAPDENGDEAATQDGDDKKEDDTLEKLRELL
jgi:uncharacterized protein YchJ